MTSMYSTTTCMSNCCVTSCSGRWWRWWQWEILIKIRRDQCCKERWNHSRCIAILPSDFRLCIFTSSCLITAIRNVRFRLVRHNAVKAKTKEICSDFPNFSMQSYLRPWLLAADLMLWCCGFTSRNNTSIPTLILFVTCPWSFSLRQAKLVVLLLLLHCALASCGTVYCNRSCLGLCVCGCVCLWVCYYDNSKLHASVLTKLGL